MHLNFLSCIHILRYDCSRGINGKVGHFLNVLTLNEDIPRCNYIFTICLEQVGMWSMYRPEGGLWVKHLETSQIKDKK